MPTVTVLPTENTTPANPVVNTTDYNWSGSTSYEDSLLQTTTSDRKDADVNSVKLDDRIIGLTPNEQANVDAIQAQNDAYYASKDASKNDFGLTDEQVARNKAAGGSDFSNDPTDPTNEDGVVSPDDKLNQKAQDDINYANDTFDRTSALVNTTTNALMDSIRRTYEDRMALMAKSNKALMGSRTQSGIRTGRSKYVQDTEAGFLNDEETAGLLRMGQLEGEMLGLLAQAEAARSKDQITLLNDHMARLGEIDDNLQAEVQNLQKMANDKLTEERLRQTAENKEAQADFDRGLERGEAAAPALAQSLEGLSPEDQQVLYEKVSDSLGIDIPSLMGFVTTAQSDLSETESGIAVDKNLMATRQQNANTATNREARLASETEDEDEYSDVTKNVLNGRTPLGDVEDSDKQEVIRNLNDLHLYDEEPPFWYTTQIAEETQQSIIPELMKEKWDIYRKAIIE